MDLAELKLFLRVDNNAEDALLTMLGSAAEKYLQNATGNQFENTNELAKLFCMVLVSDWYENRDMIGKVGENIRPTIESLLSQLTYCYEPPPEVTA